MQGRSDPVAKHGKRYMATQALVEEGRFYTPLEAAELVTQMAKSAFDETVELHLRTSADPRHADQLVRGTTLLPHGLGRPVRVLVFAQGDAARTALESGADYAGADELVEKVEGGWVEFDVAMATQDMMGKIGKLGRVLGRRGLMPNPRSNTVVQPQDLGRAIGEAKRGRLEYRMDRTAIIHCSVGKASFEPQALVENMAAVVEPITRQRPTAVKGQFIKTAFLTTTMGPSIPLELASTLGLRTE